eukprot:gnl/Hemi2/26538_TR8911_c0_g1_i1.p1 gnl/Hemi2/26538_TR8911_c0_g1~~gnl/Hemi2/26538_TR8911_c0_g1_i1.p1  ORF type:complete len:381 (-),score=94.28 gnl/Hemi2/26538_TR8911_c0_g1_i1:180-1322(-)
MSAHHQQHHYPRDATLQVLHFLHSAADRSANATRCLRELEKEFRVAFDLPYFLDLVKTGNWSEADSYLGAFCSVSDVPKAFFELRKQCYLEALDNKDFSLAGATLMVQLAPFRRLNASVYADLGRLITLDDIREDERLKDYPHPASQHRDITARRAENYVRSALDKKGVLSCIPVPAVPLLAQSHAFQGVKKEKLDGDNASSEPQPSADLEKTANLLQATRRNAELLRYVNGLLRAKLKNEASGGDALELVATPSKAGSTQKSTEDDEQDKLNAESEELTRIASLLGASTPHARMAAEPTADQQTRIQVLQARVLALEKEKKQFIACVQQVRRHYDSAFEQFMPAEDPVSEQRDGKRKRDSDSALPAAKLQRLASDADLT